MPLARYRIPMLSGGGASRSNLSCMVGGTKKATVMFSEGAVEWHLKSRPIACQFGPIASATARGASSSDADDVHRNRECCRFILRVKLRLSRSHTEKRLYPPTCNTECIQSCRPTQCHTGNAIELVWECSHLYTTTSQVPALMSHHIGASVHSRLVLREVVEFANI
jgi:hypothetical protein